MISNLLDLPEFKPEKRKVRLGRLSMVWEVQEVPYDKLVQVRREREADLHLILAATVSPNLKDETWYQEKMGCPTPVEAMKRLLRMGEIEKLCRVIDQINGYNPGSVSLMSEEDLAAMGIGAAVEELEKN